MHAIVVDNLESKKPQIRKNNFLSEVKHGGIVVTKYASTGNVVLDLDIKK